MMENVGESTLYANCYTGRRQKEIKLHLLQSIPLLHQTTPTAAAITPRFPPSFSFPVSWSTPKKHPLPQGNKKWQKVNPSKKGKLVYDSLPVTQPLLMHLMHGNWKLEALHFLDGSER